MGHPGERRAGDAIRVLHVDDEPDVAEVAATFVEREDDRFEVETTERASEALDRLATGEFDCVVSDYDMPGRNGIEFLEAVREEYPDLPFVLYTGKGSEAVASDAISAGVTDYLQKETGTSQYTVLANRVKNAVEKYWAQTELSDRDERLNLFFEQSPLGVIEWDEQFDLVRMNDAAEDILGYTEADLAGESWETIVPASDREAVAEVVADLLENRGGYHSVNENVRKDGERITCEWHNRIVTDENDETVAVFSQFQDITDRRRRERRFEAIFNNTYSFVGLLDPDGTVLEANETALSFGGLERADVVGEPVWETDWFAVSEESRRLAREAVEQARNGDLYRGEIRLQGADRTAVVDFSVRPVTDDGGEVTLLVPEGRDVTDRKRYVRRLETLVDTLPGMVYQCENERGWPMEEVRGEVEALTGYSPAEIEDGDRIYGEEIVHPDDREDVWTAVQDALDAGDPFEVTYRILTKDGTTKWVWERGQRVDADGYAGERLEGFVTDITEREAIRQELAEERKFVDQALDSLDELFYVVGTDGGLRRWNSRVPEVTGYTEDEVAGMDVLDFFPESERERVAAAVDETLATGNAVAQAHVLTADGDRIPYEFTGSRLTDCAGEVTGLVGIGRAITDRDE